MEIDKKQLSELVLKLQAGDGKAFEHIYNLTNKSAYFTALKITKNEDDAQDVLQEAYIKLLEKINELDKPESFMSWFNMIVANKAKDFMRKNNPNLFTDNVISGGKDGEEEFSVFDTIEEDNEEFIPGAGIEQAELQRQVMGLIESLSDEKRTAILLYYYNEMTTKQIAESLGVNENTVKSRLVQAKKDLAKGVKELEKKNGKLLGIAPIPVVIWALKGASAITGATFVSSGAAAATLTAVSAGSAVAATTATATAVGTGAATAGVATKVIAGIVAASIIGGGAIAGTRAVKNNKDSDITTTSMVETIDQTTLEQTTERVIEKNYGLIAKEDKKVDAEIKVKDFKYGTKGLLERYNLKTSNGNVTEESIANLDRSSFKATYDDLLINATENRSKYSTEIDNTLDFVNSYRDSSHKLKLDNKLTEQANVRAEEIAWSGNSSVVRPDGTSFVTLFDYNGLNKGSRYELFYVDTNSPSLVYIKYRNIIQNEDIEKIGIGVAKDPVSEDLVHIIHLYSSKGSTSNDKLSLASSINNGINEQVNRWDSNTVKLQEENEKIFDYIYEIPVIGDLAKYDIPIDWLIKLISDARKGF